MYKYEFKDDDYFANRIKTYPEYNIFIYQQKMYINNKKPSGTGNGGIRVYNINNNRSGDQKVYPFIESSAFKNDFRSRVPNPVLKLFTENYGYTGPYQFIATNNYGLYPSSGNITSSYSDYVPIYRNYTTPVKSRTVNYYNIATSDTTSSAVTFPYSINVTASALQNVATKYSIQSNHFIFSSSLLGRNLLTSDINFIQIPKIYYGSTIKKGSVSLDYFITGSKIGSCLDSRHNGELIESTGPRSGSVVGMVLYDEGVIMLTASHNLETGPVGGAKSANHGRIEYTPGTPVSSSWMYFGTTLNDGTSSSGTLSSASYGINFKGQTYLESMVMLARAPKGELNHSNNITYSDSSNTIFEATSSNKVYSEKLNGIKNVVSSSFISASFSKTTYISKIRVYDKHERLIGVATLAQPIRKRERDEFIFKIQLDI